MTMTCSYVLRMLVVVQMFGNISVCSAANNGVLNYFQENFAASFIQEGHLIEMIQNHISADNCDVFKELIVYPQQAGCYGDLLDIAVMYNRVALAELLITKGWDPNQATRLSFWQWLRGYQMETPLCCAQKKE